MHVPKFFRNEDFPQVQQFMRDHPFALVISPTPGGVPHATHLPVELEQNDAGQAVLVGHFSRGNPHWKALAAAGQALVIFSGEHHYISSAWYGHANVPTWNYIAVHVSGAARLQTPAETQRAITRLMDRYEPAAHSPASLDKLPPALVHRELAGVAGFEVAVEQVQAAYKLSQNREPADFANILVELEKLNTPAAADMAAAMAAHRTELPGAAN